MTTHLISSESVFQTACDCIVQGEAERAVAMYEQYQPSIPSDSDALLARWELVNAWALSALGRSTESLVSIQKALAIDPSNVHCHKHHAVLLTQLHRSDEAFLAYRRCLDIEPNNIDFLLRVGGGLHQRSFYAEAWQHYKAALSLGHQIEVDQLAGFVQAASYSGDADAVARLQPLLLTGEDGQPNYYQLWLSSFWAFQQGEYEEAWRLYDFRHQHPNIAQSFAYQKSPYLIKRWDGEYAKGTTLLVHGEQGLGDEIMFAASLPRLLKATQTVGMRVVLAVKPALVRLFADNFPTCLVLPHDHVNGLLATWPDNVRIDAQVPLANLPQFFLRTPADFALNAQPYLKAVDASADKFAWLLDTFRPDHRDTLKVGLVWMCAQNKSHELDARAIHAEQLAIFGDLKNITFVSLHNQDHSSEAAQAATLNILDLGLWHNDFWDTAGLIAHMDIVIGVDTATTHLAGAMGKRVLLPLLRYPDWRRNTPHDNCVWYSNTRYYRQENMYIWDDVLQRIKKQLLDMTISNFNTTPQAAHKHQPREASRMTIVSYAQNFEDIMLWRALKHVERGFYVDVGAHEPVSGSVSRLFYEMGWRGLHVEPTPQYIQLLRENRPDEVVAGVAVGASMGQIELTVFPNTGLSTAASNIADTIDSGRFERHTLTVEQVTLDALLTPYRGRPIHWLKIDIEGYEVEALKGWNSSQDRPWIFVIEATKPLSTEPYYEHWEHILLSAKYQFVYFDGLNRFYVAKEHPELVDAFYAPPNVFDNFIIYAHYMAGYEQSTRNHQVNTTAIHVKRDKHP